MTYRTTITAILLAVSCFVPPSRAGIAMDWCTIDGGGGHFDGTTFSMDLSIGQPDAATISGAVIEFHGGFWPGSALVALTPGDLNCDGVVNNFDIDPFVLAILDGTAYTSTYPNCPLLNADINGDHLVNNFDIDPFVACILDNGCP